MNVAHRPILIADSICKHYSEKDGVPITYVCTTEQSYGKPLVDIFYRETPHPKFGNRYFYVYHVGETVYICNADWVESLDFCMIEHEGWWHYSQHTHDFHVVGPYAIDGGRSYGRILGSIRGMPRSCYASVRDGKFYVTSDFV
jgi:hypothetical protein